MTAETNQTPRRLLRIAEVKKRSGFNSTSGLYGAIAKGDFPRPIKIGPRASAWIETEVDAWIERKIAASRGELRVA